ncbi:MAG TPA: ATP-dependent sacrificial sulfur transferase LarE [Candidatus Polarisedimenticolaceae bacterium]|nr:ATP-dependent sacrificial sulfur transferase LarE [Candidatus Polarisedimenticolaceae bacterium]
MPLVPSLAAKRQTVLERLRAVPRVLVALSGGVDSAVLLALAVEALGAGRVLAVTGQSPAVPDAEVQDARRVAALLGVPHEVVVTREMDRPGYVANAGDRCFHCRSELFDVLAELADMRGFPCMAYGAIADDLGEDRPGMRAAADRGVLAPLLEADLGKAEVRLLAAEAGLEVRDKPAAACLASRIPTGTAVSPERLRAVGEAEAGLRRLGLRQVRVRHHGEIARVETDEHGFALLRDPDLRAAACAAVRVAGFRFVALDLEGYRTGSVAGSVLVRIGPTADSGQ